MESAFTFDPATDNILLFGWAPGSVPELGLAPGSVLKLGLAPGTEITDPTSLSTEAALSSPVTLSPNINVGYGGSLPPYTGSSPMSSVEGKPLINSGWYGGDEHTGQGIGSKDPGDFGAPALNETDTQGWANLQPELPASVTSPQSQVWYGKSLNYLNAGDYKDAGQQVWNQVTWIQTNLTQVTNFSTVDFGSGVADLGAGVAGLGIGSAMIGSGIWAAGTGAATMQPSLFNAGVKDALAGAAVASWGYQETELPDAQGVLSDMVKGLSDLFSAYGKQMGDFSDIGVDTVGQYTTAGVSAATAKMEAFDATYSPSAAAIHAYAKAGNLTQAAESYYGVTNT